MYKKFLNVISIAKVFKPFPLLLSETLKTKDEHWKVFYENIKKTSFFNMIVLVYSPNNKEKSRSFFTKYTFNL